MPKKIFEKIQLPDTQPKCCAECPLCGIIPKYERPKGTKETHVCLGTRHALSGRGIVSASHRHKRPCDRSWKIWLQLPSHILGINRDFYLKYRVPFEQSRQMEIIFHR